MAFPRRGGGSALSAPRVVTLVVSLALVLLALASLKVHLPAALSAVAAHRFALLVAGYVVLLLGVVLRGL